MRRLALLVATLAVLVAILTILSPRLFPAVAASDLSFQNGLQLAGAILAVLSALGVLASIVVRVMTASTTVSKTSPQPEPAPEPLPRSGGLDRNDVYFWVGLLVSVVGLVISHFWH